MDLDLYFRFSLALVFVIALFVALALVLRRFGFGSTMNASARKRRLSIVEVAALDAKRRLVLVRRDDAEHLLLLSPTGDAVVETGVRSAFGEAMAVAGTPAAETPAESREAAP